MREKGWYPIFYMFAVTAGFSSVVIGFFGFDAGASRGQCPAGV